MEEQPYTHACSVESFTFTHFLNGAEAKKALDEWMKGRERKSANTYDGPMCLFATVSSNQRHMWTYGSGTKPTYSPAELLEVRGFHCVHRSASHNYGGGLVYWYVKNLVPLPKEEQEVRRGKDYQFVPLKGGEHHKVENLRESEKVEKPPEVAA